MASDEDRWKVSYLSWKVFQKAVLSGQGITWDSMMNADLVIGGMDFSIDFLYFLFLSLFIKSLLTL
jgi:outer membrane protease